MKILLFGSEGMLGHALADVFSDEELISLTRSDVDITREHEVEKIIEDNLPDLIINSAAFTDVDGAESNRDLALAINGDGVGYIARAAEAVGATCVHYSTDYIFNGSKHEGYDEHSNEYEPLNVYGESKLLGEQLLQEYCSRFYVIRTSWLFGPHGKNFATTMLQLGKDRDSLKVVNDQHGRPTYTVDLAQATKELVDDKAAHGIYHLTNGTDTSSITWYEFAHEIFHQAGLEVTLSPCTSDEYPRPAKRPEYSVLLNTKRPPLRDWRAALQEYIATL